MSVRTVPFAALAIALAVAGCATPAATDAPGASPSSTSEPPTSAPGVIAHPTGADEIVLRFDEAGGFVPAEFFAAHVP